MMKKRLLRSFYAMLFTLFFVFSVNQKIHAQEVVVKGQVTESNDGGPLPVVSVRVKGRTDTKINKLIIIDLQGKIMDVPYS